MRCTVPTHRLELLWGGSPGRGLHLSYWRPLVSFTVFFPALFCYSVVDTLWWDMDCLPCNYISALLTLYMIILWWLFLRFKSYSYCWKYLFHSLPVYSVNIYISLALWNECLKKTVSVSLTSYWRRTGVQHVGMRCWPCGRTSPVPFTKWDWGVTGFGGGPCMSTLLVLCRVCLHIGY